MTYALDLDVSRGCNKRNREFANSEKLPKFGKKNCERKGNEQNSPLENGANPILIIEVPFHRFADPALEGVSRRPAELLFYFRGVDSVAAIVAGTIFVERDEFAGVSTEIGFDFVHKVADSFHYANVRPFVVAAYVIALPGPSVLENLPKCFGVIANIEPIANVHAIAIDWK